MSKKYQKALELIDESKNLLKNNKFITAESKRAEACKLLYLEFKQTNLQFFLIQWLTQCINLLQLWGKIGRPGEKETRENISIKRYFHFAKAIQIANYLLTEYKGELSKLFNDKDQGFDNFENAMFHIRNQLINHFGCRMPLSGDYFINNCPLFTEGNRYHNIFNWYFSIKASYDLHCNICNKNILESGCTHDDLTFLNYQLHHVDIVPNPENSGTGVVFEDGKFEVNWLIRNEEDLEKIKSGELEIHCHYCQGHNVDTSTLSLQDWIHHQRLDQKYLDTLMQTGYL